MTQEDQSDPETEAQKVKAKLSILIIKETTMKPRLCSMPANSLWRNLKHTANIINPPLSQVGWGKVEKSWLQSTCSNIKGSHDQESLKNDPGPLIQSREKAYEELFKKMPQFK